MNRVENCNNLDPNEVFKDCGEGRESETYVCTSNECCRCSSCDGKHSYSENILRDRARTDSTGGSFSVGKEKADGEEDQQKSPKKIVPQFGSIYEMIEAKMGWEIRRVTANFEEKKEAKNAVENPVTCEKTEEKKGDNFVADLRDDVGDECEDDVECSQS